MTRTEEFGEAEVRTRLAQAGTVRDLLFDTMTSHPDRVALRSHESGAEWTYAAVRARIGEVANRLREAGVGHGEPVALMMRNVPEFHVVDAAAMVLGAVPFSIYNTSSPEQVEFVLSDSGARVAVVESSFVPLLRDAERLGGSITTILVIDGTVEGCEDLLGELSSDTTTFDFAASAAIEPHDLLTLIYTSGTTGSPKGVELTHANMLAQLRGVHTTMPLPGGGRQVGFLPAAHVADRWSSHYSSFMTYGNTLVTVADAANLAAAVRTTRPTLFGAAPRIWEKFKTALEESYPGDLTSDVATDPALAAALREKLGLTEARWLISGAAPTPVAVVEFFNALGLPLCELLGMSEVSGVPTVNTPTANRVGSVGRPLENVEVAVAEDDELLLRGPQVMKGYRGQASRTAETLDAGGWLRTGDLARIDDDGFVWLTGRKKELIISAGGKNMSPANIELALRSAGRLIAHICVIGDARPYNVALIVVEPDAAGGRAFDDPGLIAEVGAQIDQGNAALSRVEQVKKFTIVPRPWELGVELTPTMKVRRAAVLDRYVDDIERMYARPAGPHAV
ncbi:long-subunit acyl-CoA synthetase (AMP-forming) [Tamaricihabitans halophyticus]|uniref:Acyl-CoA synthetase n=1 Tax=Tamaricihabitans halophyticus TaxID=1262583 RepID=A0A4V2SR58_9PSEU|nr:AMP-dependent synthetase/ligase [Tamaricihabitans halophyticus]TCP41246.1 long-subunit acyl-CoA synthetase (AMP-forming) [Tamaricihabitans halophyticus]